MLLVTPSLAAPNTVLGDWCSANDSGESMFVQTRSIGFNEHTVCVPDQPITDTGQIALNLTCANFYIVDGETVRAFERNVWLMAAPGKNNNLYAAFFNDDQADQTMRFKRC